MGFNLYIYLQECSSTQIIITPTKRKEEASQNEGENEWKHLRTSTAEL